MNPEPVSRPDVRDFPERLADAFNSALVGLGFWMAVLWWVDVEGSWRVGLAAMGACFLGGFFCGWRFLDFAKELLRRIW